MNATKALKASIIVQWVVIPLSLVIGMYEESFLPETLKLFIESEAEKELSSTEIITFSISIIFLVAYIVTNIAIFLLRGWARKPYTILVFSSFARVIVKSGVRDHDQAALL